MTLRFSSDDRRIVVQEPIYLFNHEEAVLKEKSDRAVLAPVLAGALDVLSFVVVVLTLAVTLPFLLIWPGGLFGSRVTREK